MTFRQKHGKSGFVYAARGESTGHIKIGHSSSPRDRIRSFGSQYGEKAELIGVIPSPSQVSERLIHDNLSEHAEGRRGEWFKPHPEVLDLVSRMDPPSVCDARQPETSSGIERLIKPAEAAEVAGMDKRDLLRMARSKKVPHYRLSSRAVRFRRSEIDEWVEAQSSNGGST